MKQGAIVINLFGGPCSFKSTFAGEIFAKLKWRRINCEYIQEYAKGLVWEGSFNVLANQIKVFGEQHHRTFRLLDKTDIVVTDSPLLLSVIYDAEKRIALKNLVFEEFNKCSNINFFLKRVGEYEHEGRMQNEQEAIGKDREILELLDSNLVAYTAIDGIEDNVSFVVERAVEFAQYMGKKV